MANYKTLKPFILQYEGGFTNDPNDLGGATNKGVTLTTFRSHFGKDKTVEDLKKITDEQWDTIFLKGYWNKCKATDIKTQSVANMLVDWTYNAGINAIKRTQKLLGLVNDGIVGAKTINAINTYPNQRELFEKIKAIRIDYYQRICVARPTNQKFLKGWTNRTNAITYGYLKYNGKNVKN